MAKVIDDEVADMYWALLKAARKVVDESQYKVPSAQSIAELQRATEALDEEIGRRSYTRAVAEGRV